MSDLVRDLTGLLNRYSQENGSNTPDFILADYLLACLATWNTQVVRRDEWYGMARRPEWTTGDAPRTVGSTGDLPSVYPGPATAADPQGTP